MRTRRSVQISLLATVFASGCDVPQRPVTGLPQSVEAAYEAGGATVDLVELLPTAGLRFEHPTIDFGHPDTRALLIRGWGADETAGGNSYAWAWGERSEVEVYVDVPRPVMLRMACWPLAAPGLPEQAMEILVNGSHVADLELDRPQGHVYEVELPRAALRRGANRFEFRYAWARRPMDVLQGSDDQRALAVAWDRLELVGLRSGRPPRSIAGETPVLFLPAGSRAAYSVRARPGSELVIDHIRPAGTSGDWGLRITSRVDGEPAEVIFEGQRGSGAPLRIALHDAGTAPVELAFEAWASEQISGIELERPRLDARTPAGGSSASHPPPRLSAGDESAAALPDIVIYLIDSLRSDHLGCYGYGRPTSPRIDEFASDAALFEHARAQSSWTRPAVVSLFTGQYAHSHGVEGELTMLGEEVPVLAELLRTRGYHTAAVVTNGVIAPEFGCDRGFDIFEVLREDSARREMHQSARATNDVVRRILAARPPGRPLFLYVHTTEPHAPYQPPPALLEAIGVEVHDYDVGSLERTGQLFTSLDARPKPQALHDLVALYDGEIATNDRAFGELLAQLRGAGIYDRSMIVLLSDHGEEFGEHGRFQHGLSLFEEQLRVPLIVRPPGGISGGRRVDSIVGQVDLLPTLLEATGIEIPSGVQGRSFLPLVAGAANVSLAPSGLFADLACNPDYRRLSASTDGELKAIRYDNYDLPRARRELFDLGGDPGERVNLATWRPVRLDFLLARLAGSRLVAPPPPPITAQASEEAKNNLRALGYLK